MPEQFCTALEGIQDRTTLRVSAYPAAWRVEIVDNANHRGFGYVRSGYTLHDVLEFLADVSLQFLLGYQ